MTSFFCAQCSIKFNHQKEYLEHVEEKHLKSLIINTDIGYTVVFSRVGPGIFTCPICYSACKDINDVLSHLFCKETLENTTLNQLEDYEISKCSILKSNVADSESNDDKDSDQNYFEFLLTSESHLQSQNIKMNSLLKYNRNDVATKQSNFLTESNILKTKKTRTEKPDYENYVFKNGLEMNRIKPYFLNNRAKTEKQLESSLITRKELDSQNNQSPMIYAIDEGIVNEEPPANNSGNSLTTSNFDMFDSKNNCSIQKVESLIESLGIDNVAQHMKVLYSFPRLNDNNIFPKTWSKSFTDSISSKSRNCKKLH